MMERRALGKGISALIPERELGEKQESVLYLNIGQIAPNPFQPRQDFDRESLEELTQSIREKGVIQPVLVRRRQDKYELIAGERRLRAANLLNLKEIPAIVKDVDDKDSLEISLIENIQRQELNSIEEAHAYKYLIEQFHLTQEEISAVLGKSRATIANTLRLLNLPGEIQEEIKKGRLSFAHGRALLEIQDANQQRRLAQKIIAEGLSVRETESLVKKHRPKISRRKIPAGREPYVAVLEEELQHILATKVRIVKNKKRGHINIEFYSQEDLERIAKVLRGER
jgi:ParB family chromosome partitioning protein